MGGSRKESSKINTTERLVECGIFVGYTDLMHILHSTLHSLPHSPTTICPINFFFPKTRRIINRTTQSSSALGVRIIGFANMSVSGGGGDRVGVVEFPLSQTSVLKISKGDITKWFVDGSSDAIVNPANERMLGGGGADGAIHRAAGPELVEACYQVPEVRRGVRCPTGEARITRGFKLPAAYVVHTVGPVYDTDRNPQVSLKNSYRNTLRVAEENNAQYIAFTAISCGVYGYPYEEAASIAISTVKEFGTSFKEVHFVLFSDDIYDIWVKTADELLG
ncbi:Macro domain-containing protein [Drosera capensis]